MAYSACGVMLMPRLPADRPSLRRRLPTNREIDMLACVAAGLTVEETASMLLCSASTVKRHLENLRNKLGARSQAELVWKANLQPGVIERMSLRQTQLGLGDS